MLTYPSAFVTPPPPMGLFANERHFESFNDFGNQEVVQNPTAATYFQLHNFFFPPFDERRLRLEVGEKRASRPALVHRSVAIFCQTNSGED